jgi:hypothetical protein
MKEGILSEGPLRASPPLRGSIASDKKMKKGNLASLRSRAAAVGALRHLIRPQ